MKKHWKVSLQAIIFNGDYSGLISSRQTLFLRQQISRNKWRLHEPFDDEIPVEYPTLFNKAIQYVKNEKPECMKEIVSEVGLSEDQIFELFQYEEDKNEVRSNIHLKLV